MMDVGHHRLFRASPGLPGLLALPEGAAVAAERDEGPAAIGRGELIELDLSLISLVPIARPRRKLFADVIVPEGAV
jgi:hypothetical protein